MSAGQPVASGFLFRRALESGARPAAVWFDSKWTALAGRHAFNQAILPDIFGPREFFDLAWTARDPCLFASLVLAQVLPFVPCPLRDPRRCADRTPWRSSSPAAEHRRLAAELVGSTTVHTMLPGSSATRRDRTRQRGAPPRCVAGRPGRRDLP